MECLNQILDALKGASDIIIKAAPTLVAVLAIWINNASAQKRDRNNRDANSRLKILWNICELTDELHFEVSNLCEKIFYQASINASKIDTEKNKRIDELREKVITVQRKVKISSEIYETVGEMQLKWEKIYEACNPMINTSEAILTEVFGNEENIQLLNATLKTSLIRFEDEYKNYTKTVYKEIKRIIDK